MAVDKRAEPLKRDSALQLGEPDGPREPARGPDGYVSQESSGRSLPRALARLPVYQHPAIGPFVTGILVFGFFTMEAYHNGFLTVFGVASWLDQAAGISIVALPYSLLMIAGQFDLSIGSTLGAVSIAVALMVTKLHLYSLIAVMLGLVLGALIGLVNGVVVVKAKLPSFVATIGTNFIVAGAALGVSALAENSSQLGVVVGGIPRSMFASVRNNFDVSIAWAVGEAIIVIWLMARTRSGNWIYATGGDEELARRAGVPTQRIKIWLFVATAVGGAFLAAIQTIQFNTGNATAGQEYLFQVPMVIVLGGILLTGGYGAPIGVLIGSAIYGVVNFGIFYTGWDTVWAQTFLGGLMMFAVLTNNYLRRLALAVPGRSRKTSP